MEAPFAITRADKEGRETLIHGTTMFPIGCYYDDLTIETVPWHWHEEFDFAVVLKGDAVVCAGNMEFTVREGDGFFINSNVIHSVRLGEATESLHHSMSFHPRIVGGSLESIFWQNLVQPLQSNLALPAYHLRKDVGWESSVIRLINYVWQSYVTEQEGFELEIRYALSNALALMVRYFRTTSVPPSEKELRDNERIKTMLEYIHAHYDEPLTTGQIAGSALLSESECLRCFHSVLGTTPMKFVRQYRIEAATSQLVETNHKIADICFSCGFSDTSHFVKLFRETKGVTPKRYRQLYSHLKFV